ncbi:unnamed protein product [Boreogadus saida]
MMMSPGDRSSRHARDIMNQWIDRLTSEGREMLRDYFSRADVPDKEDLFPELGLSVDWSGLVHPKQENRRPAVEDPAGGSGLRLTLTAPDQLAVALRGRLRRRCVNVCMKNSQTCDKWQCIIEVMEMGEEVLEEEVLMEMVVEEDVVVVEKVQELVVDPCSKKSPKNIIS